MSDRLNKIKYDQVSGIFDAQDNLTDLMTELSNRNIGADDVSALMSEDTRDAYFSAKDSSKLPEGATIGGLSGGIIGAIAGGLTVVGSLLIPGLGLLAVGPIVGILAGGAIGTATGGLIGALIGAGIPEHEAKFFEDAIKERGNVLIVAHVPHDVSPEIKELFKRYGATKLRVHH